MKPMLMMTAAAVLMAAAPALAQPGHGNGHGNGNGNGQGRGQEARADHGNGNGQSNGRGQDRGRDDRGREDRGRDVRVEARPGRAAPPVGVREDRRDDRRMDGRRDDRRQDGREDGRDRDVRPVLVFRDAPRPGLINGCPPGLAKKNNGCLPPGQARQQARRWVDDGWLWRRYALGGDARYADGYLYRMDDRGGISSYLPLLGGVLSPGNAWPSTYGYQPAPAYYTDYYGLRGPYDYRYADGVLYGVDPETQAIAQVAALLTGQDWTVGQPMPAGYSVYNVPYAYRGQYADTPQSWYRYSDGQIYQVDPTTRLVQAVIQLLT